MDDKERESVCFSLYDFETFFFVLTDSQASSFQMDANVSGTGNKAGKFGEKGDKGGRREIKISPEAQNMLNAAFAEIPASSFPPPAKGEVVEISSDDSILEAVQILSQNGILSAPVRDVTKTDSVSWTDIYLGMVDFPAIIVWVLEQAELAAASLAAGTAAATGIGAGALGAMGAIAMGFTGQVAVAGLTAAAVGAAVMGGVTVDRNMGKNPQSAADALGENFYKILLQEEPFKSTKVADITRSYRWAPFLAICPDDSMLTVLLLLSKFRLRSVPVVDPGQPNVTNLITQSAVLKGLAQCRGFDWFDSISEKTLEQLGLPLMAPEQVVLVDADHLVLEAFMLMRQKDIGGLPVVESDNKLYANVSVRDVRYLLLHPDLFNRRRELTVREFVTIVSSLSADVDGSRPLLRPAISCKSTEKLVHVIEQLAEKKIHRIHVVDEDGRVTGIVTLRDIISCFVTEPKDYFKTFLGGIIESTMEDND